jgi:hypothetical protein
MGLLTKKEIYCYHGNCHRSAYPRQASSSYRLQYKITVLRFILILFIPCHIVRLLLLLLVVVVIVVAVVAVKTNNFHTQSISYIYINYTTIFPPTCFGGRLPSVE